MEAPIRSTKNPLVRRFRRAAAGDAAGSMVAEGQRLVAEALAAGCAIAEVAWSARLTGRPGGPALLERLLASSSHVHECADHVLQQLSHLETHQGVSVVLRRPRWQATDLLGPADGPPLVVAAVGVRDPGNLGALVRSAEAAGATGLCTVPPCADPYRDKAVRGSAGSIFRFPCRTGSSVAELLAFAREHDLRLVVADRGAGTVCWDCDFTRPTVLAVGAEGAGIPAELRAAADSVAAIPLAADVESLNVSVAAGILLFEARRQRSGSAK